MSQDTPNQISQGQNQKNQPTKLEKMKQGAVNLFQGATETAKNARDQLMSRFEKNKRGLTIAASGLAATASLFVGFNPANAGQMPTGQQLRGAGNVETLAQGVNMEEVANQVKGILDEYKVDSSLLQFSVISGNIVVEAKNNYGNNNVDAFESDDQNAATEINTAMRQLGNDQKRKVFGSVGIQEKLTQQNQNNTTPAFQNIPQVTPTQPSIVNPAGQGIVVPQQQNSGNGNFFN